MNELRKLIRESLSTIGDKSYRTENVNVDIYDRTLPDGDYFSSSKAVIVWEMDIDEREWGIKSIEPTIVNMSVSIEIWRENIEDYETIEKDYVINRETIEGFTLETTQTNDKGQILPMDVSIDNETKIVEIDFYYP